MKTKTNRKLFQIGCFQTAICWSHLGMVLQENSGLGSNRNSDVHLHTTMFQRQSSVLRHHYHHNKVMEPQFKGSRVELPVISPLSVWLLQIIVCFYFWVPSGWAGFPFYCSTKRLFCGPALERLKDLHRCNYLLSYSPLITSLFCFPRLLPILLYCMSVHIYMCANVFLCVSCGRAHERMRVCMDELCLSNSFKSLHVTKLI